MWRHLQAATLVTLLGLLGDPVVIQRPHSGRAPGELCPLASLVMPLFKVVLKTACIKNGKLKVIKIRSGSQYVGYLSLQLKLKMGRTKPSQVGYATGPQVGHSCFERIWRGLKINSP